ncbi:hypothetical protein BU16DRAFT_535512 [Lophium mytilinum]|uniref:Uncharacterized protein n=1 Tax=Lophium mytilinum TaxID=390894 RepID=A0A6A6R303_9PEZI|nr:hypothetical protein BU16DRAFT_535512 [Lophium mytilinum]
MPVGLKAERPAVPKPGLSRFWEGVAPGDKKCCQLGEGVAENRAPTGRGCGRQLPSGLDQPIQQVVASILGMLDLVDGQDVEVGCGIKRWSLFIKFKVGRFDIEHEWQVHGRSWTSRVAISVRLFSLASGQGENLVLVVACFRKLHSSHSACSYGLADSWTSSSKGWPPLSFPPNASTRPIAHQVSERADGRWRSSLICLRKILHVMTGKGPSSKAAVSMATAALT